jgi:hypothetical protein
MVRTQAEACAAALLKQGESTNTARSYTSGLRYWDAWHRLRYRTGLNLPVPVTAVLQFLFDHVECAAGDGTLVYELPEEIDQALVDCGFKAARGVPSLNTVMHRLAVLSTIHRVRGLPNPARDPSVQELARRVESDYRVGCEVSAIAPCSCSRSRAAAAVARKSLPL